MGFCLASDPREMKQNSAIISFNCSDSDMGLTSTATKTGHALVTWQWPIFIYNNIIIGHVPPVLSMRRRKKSIEPNKSNVPAVVPHRRGKTAHLWAGSFSCRCG